MKVVVAPNSFKGSLSASEAAAAIARGVRQALPDADIIEADFAQVPFDRVLDTGRFDFEKAQQHPLWYKELYGFADHTPETEEYGVTNFVYRARRPFDPAKFQAFLRESWGGVIRSKGRVEVQAIGAGAINQAVKAIAISRGYVAPRCWEGEAISTQRRNRSGEPRPCSNVSPQPAPFRSL